MPFSASVLPFPLGVVSGTYDSTFDLTSLSSYSLNFVTANGGTAASAEAALIADLNARNTYVDIHDANFPGGEIRGNVTVTPVPGPVPGAGLLSLAIFILAGLKRKMARDGVVRAQCLG